VAMGPTDRLLRATRRRLVAMTMGLLTLLVVGVGAATAFVGLNALDADVDQALSASVTAQLNALGGELPTSSGDNEADEQVPATADTFLLVLDSSGTVVQNRSGIALDGLPDADALAAARSGRDLRTVRAGSVNVRLLTAAIVEDGKPIGYVQGGFVLTLHDQQSQSLVVTVITVGAMALVAAAFITLIVTGRALRPIRHSILAQRQFVADASHELRTPAALIRANAEVLQREALVARDGEPLLADVIAEADRLGGLVGELLQLAAWDETRPTLEPVSLDIAALAGDIVRGAGALAAEREVRLEVEAPRPVSATGDRGRLVQLLLILIDNAIDHSPAGGVVTVRVANAGRAATIEVSDQGPGIPEAETERIFEPFTRLSGTTRHGSGGTGLGLAIARRIVAAHGGGIRASSSPGGGARFTVMLPAEGSHTAPTP
jgi:signal transduction histidine kinase